MRSPSTAAWSVTGLAAASVVAVTLGMGLQGGATAAPLGTSAPLVASSGAPSTDDSFATATARRDAGRTAEAGEDVSGPCDEVEHAGDPRCTGVALAPARATGEDVSGPCDEAEHANDPRCTGVVNGERGGQDARGEDRRGRAGERESGDDRRHDRRGRGSSSGSGGQDDSRGPGSGHDDSSGRSGHDGSGHDDSGHDDSGD